MNAITQTDPEAEFTFDHAAFHELEPGVPDHTRYDGWTAEKQKRFLTALSLGHPINRACAIVELSRQSAYALRNAARRNLDPIPRTSPASPHPPACMAASPPCPSRHSGRPSSLHRTA